MIPRGPAEILDAQAALAHRLIHPAKDDVGWLHGFMSDAVRKQGDRAAGMFAPVLGYPARMPTLEKAAAFARVLGKMVSDGVTYEVTPEMVSMMQQALPETSGKIQHMEAAEMPAEAGFAWLDETWGIVTINQRTVQVRALSWQYTTMFTDGTESDRLDRPQRWPCVRISVWTHLDDDIAANRIDYDGAAYDDMLRRCGPMTIIHTAVLPFGMRFIAPEAAAGIDDVLAMVHILWMFLTMEITVSHRPQLPRHFRRRALKSLKHGEVNVIILRRAKDDPDYEPGHAKIDWSCRWVVQGHSRHIESYEGKHHQATTAKWTGTGADRRVEAVCVVCGKRTTFVRPYIKGPSDRPIKVSRQIMKLAR